MSNSKETSKSLSINERLIVNLTRIYEDGGYINPQLEDKVCSQILDGNVDENGYIRDKSQALLKRAIHSSDKKISWFWHILLFLPIPIYFVLFVLFIGVFKPKETLLYINSLFFWGYYIPFYWFLLIIICNVLKLLCGIHPLWWLLLTILKHFELLPELSIKDCNMKDNVAKKTIDYFNKDPSFLYLHFGIYRFVSCISMFLGIVFTSF
ncbi:MAG: hypothetical protein IKS45_04705, partial [Thermoguttaceae bacterium]|nr:hypothetical protein [Thermoguttaceae bacterium]